MKKKERKNRKDKEKIDHLRELYLAAQLAK